MSDDKEPRKKDEEGKEEEVKKDLDEIMEKLTESGAEKKPESHKAEEEPKQPSAQAPSPEQEPEDLEGILEKISEKEERPEAPVEELSTFQRVVSVFTQPRRLFEYLRQKPDWVVPIIVVVLFSLAASFLVYDIAIDDQIKKIEQNENIPDERKDTIIDNMEARREGAWRYVSILAFPVVGVFVAFSLVSLVFLFIGNVILGGKARFKQIFSVYAYAYLIPAILGSIIKIPLILQKHSLDVRTSLALFLPSAETQSTLFRLLDSFDIFTLWFLAVFGIGYAIVYKFSTTKGLIAVFFTWLVWVLITKVALASLFSAFGA